jgi:hypothetical protein
MTSDMSKKPSLLVTQRGKNRFKASSVGLDNKATTVQASAQARSERFYTSTKDCLGKQYQRGGVANVYRGFLSALSV